MALEPLLKEESKCLKRLLVCSREETGFLEVGDWSRAEACSRRIAHLCGELIRLESSRRVYPTPIVVRLLRPGDPGFMASTRRNRCAMMWEENRRMSRALAVQQESNRRLLPSGRPEVRAARVSAA
jgi:hypothetical protein